MQSDWLSLPADINRKITFQQRCYKFSLKYDDIPKISHRSFAEVQLGLPQNSSHYNIMVVGKNKWFGRHRLLPYWDHQQWQMGDDGSYLRIQ